MVSRFEKLFQEYLECHLENLIIKVEGRGYSIDKLPTFKINFLNEEKIGIANATEPLRKVDYKTITLDTSKLSKLTHKSMLGCDITPDCITAGELSYYYDLSVHNFKEHLESMNFNDLII